MITSYRAIVAERHPEVVCTLAFEATKHLSRSLTLAQAFELEVTHGVSNLSKLLHHRAHRRLLHISWARPEAHTCAAALSLYIP